MKNTINIITMLIFLTSCNNSNITDEVWDNLLMATLYNINATEYEALAFQAYNIATEKKIKFRQAFQSALI